MPARVHLHGVLEQVLLKQLGERLARARRDRRMAAARLAGELGISRNTLKAAECGDPSVTMGTYLRILSALGCAGDLALVASGAPRGAKEDSVARRHAQLESEVAQGLRDARSLVAVPRGLATSARATFPEGAFGEVQPW